MFKQLVIAIVLGVSLFSSIALWAQNEQAPVIVAQLQVERQLSISAHQNGEENFIEQVSVQNQTSSVSQVRNNTRVPVLTMLGVMVFGLVCFVLRVSRKRIN